MVLTVHARHGEDWLSQVAWPAVQPIPQDVTCKDQCSRRERRLHALSTPVLLQFKLSTPYKGGTDRHVRQLVGKTNSAAASLQLGASSSARQAEACSRSLQRMRLPVSVRA